MRKSTEITYLKSDALQNEIADLVKMFNKRGFRILVNKVNFGVLSYSIEDGVYIITCADYNTLNTLSDAMVKYANYNDSNLICSGMKKLDDYGTIINGIVNDFYIVHDPAAKLTYRINKTKDNWCSDPISVGQKSRNKYSELPDLIKTCIELYDELHDTNRLHLNFPFYDKKFNPMSQCLCNMNGHCPDKDLITVSKNKEEIIKICPKCYSYIRCYRIPLTISSEWLSYNHTAICNHKNYSQILELINLVKTISNSLDSYRSNLPSDKTSEKDPIYLAGNNVLNTVLYKLVLHELGGNYVEYMVADNNTSTIAAELTDNWCLITDNDKALDCDYVSNHLNSDIDDCVYKFEKAIFVNFAKKFYRELFK